MPESDLPETIHCAEQVFSVSFHPNRPFLAAGLIDGSIELWKHRNEHFMANRYHQNLTHHTASCRAVSFHPNGEHLYSTSSDRTWQIINTEGKAIRCMKNAHNSSINKLLLLNEHLFTTGDDSGVVKLWDNRLDANAAAVMSWDAHTDFIADFDYFEENHQLFSASGDATLCVYDIRNEKHFYKSDDQESELHCVRVMKGGRKVLCGGQDGVMLLFNSGQWGDCSDRFPGHPETVDCMLKVDESTVLTGSSDGMIRVISVLPNKIIGVIGDHEDFPVEGLMANQDHTLLASIAHDEMIRFWDISILNDDDEGEEEDGGDDDDSSNDEEVVGEEMDSDDDVDEEAQEEDDDSSDMEEAEEEEESSEDSDSSSSSSDEEDNAKQKLKARKMPQANAKPSKKKDESEDSDDSDDEPYSKRKKLPTAAERFYADM